MKIKNPLSSLAAKRGHMKISSVFICLLAICLAIGVTVAGAQTTTCKPIFYGQPEQGMKCETQQSSSGFNQPNYSSMAQRAYQQGQDSAPVTLASPPVKPAASWEQIILEGAKKKAPPQGSETQRSAALLIGKGRCREAILVALNASDMESAKATLDMCKFLYPDQIEQTK